MEKFRFTGIENSINREEMRLIKAGSSTCSDGKTNTLICHVHTGEIFEFCYCQATGDPYSACDSRLYGYQLQNASRAISLECVTWCQSFCVA